MTVLALVVAAGLVGMLGGAVAVDLRRPRYVGRHRSTW